MAKAGFAGEAQAVKSIIVTPQSGTQHLFRKVIMMDINKVGVSNTVPTVPQQLSGQSVDKGSTGVYATIDNLIAMLQKMNIDIRDMERDFHAAGQQRAAAVQLSRSIPSWRASNLSTRLRGRTPALKSCQDF